MAGDSEGGGNDQWRFAVDDVGEPSATGEDGTGNVAGSLDIDEEIEPGEISLENAAFVLVGIALAVLVLAAFLNLL